MILNEAASFLDDWTTRFSHFGHVENLVGHLVARSDLVGHLVARASGRRSSRGRCGHLYYCGSYFAKLLGHRTLIEDKVLTAGIVPI